MHHTMNVKFLPINRKQNLYRVEIISYILKNSLIEIQRPVINPILLKSYPECSWFHIESIGVIIVIRLNRSL